MVQNLLYEREVSDGYCVFEAESFVVEGGDFGYDSYSGLVCVFLCVFVGVGCNKVLGGVSVFSLSDQF